LAVDRVDKLLSQTKDQIVWTIEPLHAGLDVFDALEEKDRTLLPGGKSVLVRMQYERIGDYNRKIVEAGVRVHGIELKQPALEELFLEMTEGETID
jgi:ABC-2 type transport system ATP-binding protein